jgi:hypothetical protein
VAQIDLESSLDALEQGLATGELDDGRPALAYLAGRDVSFEDEELHGARRRALLLLAAGGAPLRGLELDGRAVAALAADLERPERRAGLSEELKRLRGTCTERPYVARALDSLTAEPDLAWRALSMALLAEALEQ